MTSHFWHTAFASWICVIAGPVFPIGKNSSGSWLRHSARWRQSIVPLSFQDATPHPVGHGAARVAPRVGAFSGLRLDAAELGHDAPAMSAGVASRLPFSGALAASTRAWMRKPGGTSHTPAGRAAGAVMPGTKRSEEHTSELQSRFD